MITIDKQQIEKRLEQRLLKYKGCVIDEVLKNEIEEDLVDELLQINKEITPFAAILLDPDHFYDLYNNLLHIINNE